MSRPEGLPSLPLMARPNYRDLTHEQLVSLLEARDRKKFGHASWRFNQSILDASALGDHVDVLISESRDA
jgi:hypothetical protein